MEVLTEVDPGRIKALRARDEFFWLPTVLAAIYFWRRRRDWL